MSGEAKEGRERTVKQIVERFRTWQGHSLAAVLILLAGYLLVLAVFFPIDMDELLPYHPIACSSPAQALNDYTAACGGYPIQVGPVEYQRSFEYIGALPSVILAPFFMISNWIGWHLLAGVVALGLAALGAVKSVKLPWAFALAIVAWIPISLATVHDTGPIRYSLLVITWTPVLTRLYCTGRHPSLRIIALVLLTLGWIAATESKPFFAFLIPGTITWTVAALAVTRTSSIHLPFRRLFFAMAIPTISVALFLILATVEGEPYLLYLSSFGSPNSLWMSAGMGFVFLFNWTMSAQRFIFQYPNVDSRFPELLQGPVNSLPLTADRGAPLSLILMMLVALLAAGLIGWASWSLATSKDTAKRRQALWFALATVAFFAGATVSRGGSLHHFVYAQIPVVVAVVLALRNRGWGPYRATAVVMTLSTLALVSMRAIPFKPQVSMDIDRVMSRAIEEAQPGSVVNCQSWGCYYRYALESRNDVPILWAERPDQQIALMGNLPYGAHIWHVCLDCNFLGVKSAFPGANLETVLETPSGWSLFKVTP